MGAIRSEYLHLTLLCQSTIASGPFKDIHISNYVDMHIVPLLLMWTVGFGTFAAISCKIARVSIIIFHLFVCPSIHMSSFKSCFVGGSHSGVAEGDSHLGCDAVSLGL